MRHTLLRLKFDGHLYLAPLLGNFLLESVSCLPRPDVIVAVPQHPAHLRRRGYNQAHELARTLHGLSGLPLSSRLLTRPVPGQEQAHLGAKDRRSNVRHSFAASPEARGLRVWIVDDVMYVSIKNRILTPSGQKSRVCVNQPDRLTPNPKF